MRSPQSAVLAVFLLFCIRKCCFGWLSGDWLGENHSFRTRQRPEFNWKHRVPRFSITESNALDPTAIAHIVRNTYNFTLPPVQLRRSLAYLGGAARLRRVVQKLAVGSQPGIKVAVIGGSISYGEFAHEKGRTDWFSIFAKWLISAFPRANVTARNGCTPGVPTPYMILCLELSVDPDVDLVFMEYTLNDAYSVPSHHEEAKLLDNPIVKNAERLVRRVLALPQRPAVVFMHSPPCGMASYPVGHPKNPNSMPYRSFPMTSEDIQGAISQYYDVQYLSMRTAMYRLAVHKQELGFLWEDMFVDHHPGDHGHKIMADLAVHLIQQVALGLLLEPYGREEEEVVWEALPAPMYDGNSAPNSVMCSVAASFRQLVVLSEGFDYINEGTAIKPKPGYVATQPGSRLQLRVNTDRSAVGSPPDGMVHVYLHHLRSYEHMGMASISCVSGCSCQEVAVDALIQDRVSQVYLAGLTATQSPDCIIQVKVLEQTNSGEHKFKVSGVVVAEVAGKLNGLPGLNAAHDQEFGLRQHLDEQNGINEVTFTSHDQSHSVQQVRQLL
ncbi:hypothetical protein Vafri_17825 [Volvox africanus]|uniref:SGNH hydrolase-type esterase domain-containing protein n=1 Tax=Volvox africanus TaxID=51714 RepID=A0A8J4FAJ7_9CHLO|nr:hypothetical protein Vafri_17825 [Volvox africanus]